MAESTVALHQLVQQLEETDAKHGHRSYDSGEGRKRVSHFCRTRIDMLLAALKIPEIIDSTVAQIERSFGRLKSDQLPLQTSF